MAQKNFRAFRAQGILFAPCRLGRQAIAAGCYCTHSGPSFLINPVPSPHHHALPPKPIYGMIPAWLGMGLSVGFCTWLAALFISMNWQVGAGLRLVGVTTPIALLAMACLFFAKLERRKIPWILPGIFAGVAGIGLLWGINDPCYWDGIQTLGRGLMLYEGDFSEMRRLSLTYVILGFVAKYLANADWAFHLYMIACTVVLLFAISRVYRHQGLQILAVFMALSTPYVFVLSKWIYLDMPAMAGIAATLVAYGWAAQKPSLKRFLAAGALLAATVTLKEVGALVFIPLALLPWMAPKSSRRQIGLAVFVSVAVCAGIAALMAHFHFEAHGDKDEANWLLFNPRFGPPRTTWDWFSFAALEQLRALAWWGYLFLALAGLFRPRRRIGFYVIALVLGCQAIGLLAIKDADIEASWKYAPLQVIGYETLMHWLLLAVPLILLGGWISRSLEWKRHNLQERLFWVCAIAFVFTFSVAGKIYERKSGQLWISTDWRYIAPIAPLVAALGASSAAGMLSWRNPMWFRMLAALVLALSILFCIVRSANMAVYFGEKARSMRDAFTAASAQPARLAYTHWPFHHGKKPYDYGSLRWKSMGFTFKSIDILRAAKSGGSADLEPGILVHSDDFYTGTKSRQWFPTAILDSKVRIYYMKPLKGRPKKETIGGNYVARVP